MGRVDKDFSAIKYLLKIFLAAIAIILIITVPTFVGTIALIGALIFSYFFLKPNHMSYRQYSIKFVIVSVLISLCVFVLKLCKRSSNKNFQTPSIESVIEGSGIHIGSYSVIEKFDDNELQEDGWGQQVFLIKQNHPISNRTLDSLVIMDDRWKFQNDARQQYIFSEKKENVHKAIYVSTVDSIISLSYEWKK